ncbi:MAG TPA: FAD-dependent oxidoreductase [Burkholderiales bacterium]|nr:FAD-dependent oxidoreductase [Burkholderiales bacterium]
MNQLPRQRPERNALEHWQSRFGGQVVRRGDADYDRARQVWNRAIGRHPALIAYCASEADIAAAIEFARSTGLVVTVRGGGHSIDGLSVCDDALVIDLSRMKTIAIDSARRPAQVQAGVTSGEFTRAAQAHGLAVPTGNFSGVGLCNALVESFSPPVPNVHFKALALPALTDGVIDLVIDHCLRRTSPVSAVVLKHIHGAAARVAPDATAVAQRLDHYFLEIIARWADGAVKAPHIEWAEAFWAALRPFALEGVYVNWLGDEGGGRARASYGQNYARLARIKRAYDPGNFFRSNQNIPPARAPD